ncbi:MAG: SPFH domain-containing protein [Syntrophobacteraceae bacterium]
MGSNNVVFLEVIEWLDPTGQEMVQRIPEDGSGEIKYGAQLTVRESQVGVFFYQGKAIHVFGAGRHTLKTANIPILTKLLSAPWGFMSPLRAEVYFVSTKVFTDLKWGTRDPVAFKDSELGLIRLRAHGVFNLRVLQPLLFINTLVGTVGSFGTDLVEEYLNRVIVSRFNDVLGEGLSTVFDLPGRYEEWAAGLKGRLQEDFSRFGLALVDLYINSITPPPEVQHAIDDRSKLGVFQDLNKLLQLKAAMALEKAAENPGTVGEGLGLGLAFMMPGLLSRGLQAQGGGAPSSEAPLHACPDCGRPVPEDALFCPACGHHLVVITQCTSCGKNLPVKASFCTQCGKRVSEHAQNRKCSHCGTENLSQSVYCNNCGERL